MEDDEVTEKQVSKQSKSHTMNLGQEQTQEKEMTNKNLANELNLVSHKNEQRKYNQQQIAFLVNQFALSRNKAINLLRKVDLRQATQLLINE